MKLDGNFLKSQHLRTRHLHAQLVALKTMARKASGKLNCRQIVDGSRVEGVPEQTSLRLLLSELSSYQVWEVQFDEVMPRMATDERNRLKQVPLANVRDSAGQQ